MGGHHNSNFIFGCFHFLPFLAIFGHFWAIFAFLGIFAFLSGFKRTSELYNNQWDKGGSLRGSGGVLGRFGPVWGSQGVLGGVKRGLLDPYTAIFASLEVLYRTKFGSKHNIMVQLPNVDKVGITDLFLELSGHLQGPPKDDFMAKQAILRPQIVPKLPFWTLKQLSDGPY